MQHCRNQLKQRNKVSLLLLGMLLLTCLLNACTNNDVTVGAAAATTTPLSSLAATTVLPEPTATPFLTTATTEVPPTIPPVTPPTTLTLLPTTTNPPATPTAPAVSPPAITDTITASAAPGNSPNVISVPVTATTTVPIITATPKPPATAVPSPSVYKDQIVFSNGGDIWTIKAGSVAKSRLTTDGGNFDREAFPEGFNRNPVWSPDGKQIVFASARDVYIQPHYDSGYELYLINANGGGLQRISQSSDGNSTQRLPVAWLSTGQLLIRIVRANKQQLALFVIATHQEYPLPIKDAQFLAYSPDKASIAYTTLRPGPSPAKTISDLLVVNANGGVAKNLTKNTEEINNAITELAWSPEGARIAYIESNGDACGYSHLYVVGADGSGKRQIREGDGLISNVSWSADGTRLVYGEVLCTGETTLKIINFDGGQTQTLTEGQNPQWNDN